MVVRVEDLVRSKTISSKTEIEIDEYLTSHFRPNNPEKKIRYILSGENRKYYKKNKEVINELYRNAGWNVTHEIWPKIEGHRTEELIFRVKK